jgi:hypothetical protein
LHHRASGAILRGHAVVVNVIVAVGLRPKEPMMLSKDASWVERVHPMVADSQGRSGEHDV